MRGFLIHPFLVEIAQLDAEGTAADVDGAGVLDSGYDEDFREPIVFDQDDERQTTRQESTVHALAQIDPSFWERLQMLRSGQSPETGIELTFHITDLEDRSLIDLTTGDTTIKTGDRLVSISDCDGELIQSVPTPPGLYVTHVRPAAFMGSDRNLFVATFEARAQGVTR